MAGSAPWGRRVAARTRSLRVLLRDSLRALHDVQHVLECEPDVYSAVQELGAQASRCCAVVLLGRSAEARARLLHCLLGRRLLPAPAPRGCRWLRVQYGSTTQAHLTLGFSEFELVEELHCNRGPWDTIPLEDLLRQGETDLATKLEIELNNPFLKDGLKIIIPPDLDTCPSTNYADLKKTYPEFYSKRDLILKNFNPVYLYAVDTIGKCVFSENFCSDSMVISKSDEDFWTLNNLYSPVGSGDSEGGSGDKCGEKERVWRDGGAGESAVFSSENCLDLHQIKEINPNAEVLFVLFSDSADVTEENRREDESSEATESTEDTVYRSEELPESDQGLVHDRFISTPESLGHNNPASRRLHEKQMAFMNDLLDQWELMSGPPQKHHAKSEYLIVDDFEILRTVDQKASPADLPAPGAGARDTCGARCKRREDMRVRGRAALGSAVAKFGAECMQSYLLEYCTRLSEIHVRLLQQFILASFDMARELQVVPRKVQYVAQRERQLYETINKKFSDGEEQQELLLMMQEVLEEMRVEIHGMDWSVDDLPWHQDRRFMISNSIFYSSASSPEQVSLSLTPTSHTSQASSQTASQEQAPSDGEEAESYDSHNFDDYEIIQSNDESLYSGYERYKPPADDCVSVSSQPGAIRVENETEMFSLSRAWRGAGGGAGSGAGTASCSTLNLSVKQASLDVQHTVLAKLSRKISLKLVKFVDCLKDNYFGTLQRCLESLESSCRQELGGRPASEAMRQLLSVARQVDLQPCAAFSLLRSLLDALGRLLHRFRVSGGSAERACCVLSPAWRRHAALHAAHSLSAQRLARLISTQILERLRVAHERYQAALCAVEAALASRLHHTEETKLTVRKKYAPAFARLCLESTSMCDLLTHGAPELGREIGRGQYGVVYAARGAWGGAGACAVKSVLPADERHYHELAMEFFYTRSIPAHPRIVRLRGSIVQRHGTSGSGPCVLLISERKCRDLHSAVRSGLSFASRMRISCDIVEGIRYLHSLGLVHRDIKMKNVLLDAEDRASLSDLGFCAAEALISGSVVGTPVHMAPELQDKGYDAAVDVYAFGILFWYVCAGSVKLPAAFEVFQNKEQLWAKVKRGLRPERLPHFTDECWEVMESCWAPDPAQRAHLGHIQPKLEAILQRALADGGLATPGEMPSSGGDEGSEDDSII